MVVINRKTTKFESNSQLSFRGNGLYKSCYQSQNYKIWKQFTTLWCDRGDNYELLSIAKLQNLKAIHNGKGNYQIAIGVVINRKTTKFESNSQHIGKYKGKLVSCYQSQNYKIWKQFTTLWKAKNLVPVLLSIAKLQNLKAIHNVSRRHYLHILVVINRKTTKFESNSQPVLAVTSNFHCCYQSQNYKIWKQFTTNSLDTTRYLQLLSITKLQNLKAIHNKAALRQYSEEVVINHKTTKFESNSQPAGTRTKK